MNTFLPLLRINVRTLMVLITMTSALSIHAQNNPCVKNLGINGCLVYEDGKYGVKNNGKYLIPSYFDTIIEAESSYFMVKQNNRWGLFSNKGFVLVPVSYFNIQTVDAKRGLFEISGHGTKNIALINDVFRMPGFTRINEKLNASQTEVSMHEYLCFMQYIADKSPDWVTLEMAMPDTVCMDSKYLPILRAFYRGQPSGCNLVFNETMQLGARFECTFTKNEMRVRSLSLPVCCISFEQTLLFNRFMADKLTSRYVLPGDPFYTIVRLPHPYEWEEMAYTGLSDDRKKTGIPDTTNKTGCRIFNYKSLATPCSSDADRITKAGEGAYCIREFYPQNNGVYGVFGNVAEMTSEKKLCKGGSFESIPRECSYDRIQIYSGPQPWLGFRYVVEVRRKE